MQWSRLATCMHPYCCVCRQVYYMVRSKQFDWAILVVILTNSALMAVTWYGAPEVLVSTLEYINKGYTFIYMIEAALKVRMWPAGQGGGGSPHVAVLAGMFACASVRNHCILAPRFRTQSPGSNEQVQVYLLASQARHLHQPVLVVLLLDWTGRMAAGVCSTLLSQHLPL